MPSVAGVNTAYLVVLTGFATTMALIAAIGAQNAFVLRQGIRGEHVLPVVALCAVSDLVLIFAGIAGFGAPHRGAPRRRLRRQVRRGGLPDRLRTARGSARAAPGTLTPSDAAPARLGGVLATCLALTFLNPHVYLDTVILLGALANEHQEGRWLFGVGAVTASVVWFSGLGFGARKLSRFFATPGRGAFSTG